MVFSNVPGPQFPCYVGGKKVDDLHMYFPNLIPQVGILSYNGQVSMNIIIDEKVITSPNMLVEGFLAELEDLKAQVLCIPGNKDVDKVNKAVDRSTPTPIPS